MEQFIILQGITLQQLYFQIEAIIEKKITETFQDAEKVKLIRYMGRKEVANYLHISLPTLHEWTKLGWIKCYKIGTRILYKNDEVDESILSRKFKHV